MTSRRKWTPEEDEAVRAWTGTAAALGERLGRTTIAVSLRRMALGVPHCRAGRPCRPDVAGAVAALADTAGALWAGGVCVVAGRATIHRHVFDEAVKRGWRPWTIARAVVWAADEDTARRVYLASKEGSKTDE